jgi:hypothetical protein
MDDVELRTLARRVALLEDERAVLRTLHAYGHAIDHGDEDTWVDLFTEDAVFEARSRNPSDVRRVTRGRDDLATFAAHFSRPPDGWHKHLVFEPLIDIDGDVADVRSYLAVVRDDDGTPVLWVFGRYRDTLVRCADGKWRFRERVAEVESVLSRLPSLAYRWP